MHQIESSILIIKMRIGLISDTHSYMDDKILAYLSEVDEIWHAGDIGNQEVIAALEKLAPVKVVYGNVDGGKLRYYPEVLTFEAGGLKVLMVHIAGPIGRYNPTLRALLKAEKPQILVCGHSHILKVQKDAAFENLLYINPGAAGIHGFHKMRTIIRMEILEGKITKMEVVELGKRGVI